MWQIPHYTVNKFCFYDYAIIADAVNISGSETAAPSASGWSAVSLPDGTRLSSSPSDLCLWRSPARKRTVLMKTRCRRWRWSPGRERLWPSAVRPGEGLPSLIILCACRFKFSSSIQQAGFWLAVEVCIVHQLLRYCFSVLLLV